MSKQTENAGHRGVHRTLSIIRALNSRRPRTVTEISNDTGISRPAIYRVLEALCDTGYASRHDQTNSYKLTSLILSLTDALNEDAWIREIALPIMQSLMEKIIWPVDLAQFKGDAMYLVATTRANSPLSIDERRVGLRVPVLASASGRVYLAYCSAKEREEILRILKSQWNDKQPMDHNWVMRIIAETRANGYGQRYHDFMPESGSISIPIIGKPGIIACLSITFISSALKPKEAASRYLDDMRKGAMQIEQRLSGDL